MRATSTIHNRLDLIPGSRVLTVRFEPGLAVAHFTYLNCEDFIERLNRYTNIEAQQAFARGERTTPVGAFLTAAKELLSRYIKGRGFQDSWRGFYISLFYTFYRIAIAAKLQELTAVGNRDWIESRYRQEAEDILKAYGEPPARAAS